MTKSILMVIANKWFQDYEYGIPRNCFEDAWFKITVAAGVQWECVWAFGAKVKSDMSLSQADAQDYDMVVFVWGWWAYAQYFKDPEYLRLAKTAKSIWAICIAPTLISDAGVLSGKKCTGRDDGEYSQISYITANGWIYQPYDVVQDWNIITANGPWAAHEFAQKIVKFLT
jgi:putative intracellular protease/amidase